MKCRIVMMIVGLCGTAMVAGAATQRVLDESQITAARFATADLNGDGRQELIIGGRVGRFRPRTDPPSLHQARIEVYVTRLGINELVAISPELHQIDDVAAVDLTGDGRAEIIAVGGSLIHILSLQEGQLRKEQSTPWGSGRLWRVSAVAGASGVPAQIVVASYQAGYGQETRHTTLHVLTYQDFWHELDTVQIPDHVGDLCVGDLNGDGRIEVLVERGNEEIGGAASVYSLTGGALQERFTQQLSSDQQRLLSLTSSQTPDGPVLATGMLQGAIEFWRMQGYGLIQLGAAQVGTGMLYGVHLRTLPDGRLELMAGTTRTGASRGSLWRMANVGSLAGIR